MNTKKALFAFAAAVAAFSTSGVYADLPAPTTPNPGLKYYYPVPKSENPVAFMGAAEASARMNAQKAVKQLRNQINRQTNCDTANLGKTARANAQTTRAIRFLQEQGALETLPEVLQQAAAIRMENPDLSLTALCACFDPPVSKSGLSHRMKKLEALAEDLRRRLEENAEKEETK